MDRLKYYAIIFLLLFYSCDTRRNAIGADNELMVLASDKHKGIAVSFLQKIFNDTIFTPQPEPVYKIKFAKPVNFSKLKRHSNLIIVSLGNDTRNSGTKLVRNLLGKKKFLETIFSDEHIIISENQFAENQLFMIISAPDERSLMETIEGKENWIKSLFEEKYNHQQRSYLFRDARQNDLEDSLMNNYSWNIKIPWGWEKIKENSDSNFVWLGKEYPYQWLSVYWKKQSNILDSSSVADMIFEFPLDIFRTIRFDNYRFRLLSGDDKSWYDWKASGIWESIQEPKGGPFSLFLKFDELNQRIFMINSLIHYPGENKSNYMRQMELISSTIKFKKIN